jgi:acyl-CoA reductase-like NAD-dependent aldehyde dehydrogenase
MGIQTPGLAQRAFFESGATRTVAWRQQQLRSLLDALERHESALLDALHLDLGKPPIEAWVSEIGFLRGEIRYALRHIAAWAKPRRAGVPLFLQPASARVVPDPRGVALIVGPWNYPLQLLLAPAIAALAAGNTVVLKPSEHAPHTADALARLVADTFSPEILTVVHGSHDVVLELIGQKPDIIFFTGGATGAKAVLAAAAAHLIPAVLELGGKSPCVVCADAPLETTARRIVWGKFLNAGQTCVAPDHLWIQSGIFSPFVDELKKAITAFYGAVPDQSADYGRICHNGHLQRLQNMLGDAEILHGGKVITEERFIEPTLLGQPKPGTPLAGEEIFGPLLPVMKFDDLSEVIEAQRGRPIPLALYIFTKDREKEKTLVSGIRSGGVCVNDTLSHILPPQLPFGGVGESGMGSYHGKAGFHTFSHQRSVMRRAFLGENSFRYPPVPLPLAKLKRILRWFGS